jgi:hypothetical protein
MLQTLINDLEALLNDIKALPVSPKVTDLINRIEKILDILKLL